MTVIREMKTQELNLRAVAFGAQEVEETPEKETWRNYQKETGFLENGVLGPKRKKGVKD